MNSILMKDFKNEIMATKLLLSSILVLTSLLSYGQEYLPNGTFGTASFINLLQSNYSEEEKPFDTSKVNLNAALSLNFYITKDSSGNTNFSSNFLDSYIDEVNSFFKPVGISYMLNKIQDVDEYSYAIVDKADVPQELLTKYQSKSQINVYLVDSVMIDSNRHYAFTYFPDKPDSLFIFMAKGSMNGKNLTTQLGHFMGLLPTGEQGTATEYTDGSNCNTGGDMICDTDADPGLYGSVDDQCLYRGTVLAPNDKYFTPSVANLMSDAPEDCRCIFTMQQYRRIYYYYKNYRLNLH